MSKLINLNYAIHSVRIELINNNPWFCLVDVCEILSITNHRNVTTRLDEKGVRSMDTLTKGGNQLLTFVNEPNLYRVIFQSRKEEATKFQDWVFNEVLPTIRKTGNYSATPPQPVTIDGYMDRELRNQMTDIVRYFRNSSNQVSAKLWEMIKSQLHIQRITDMSRNDYPAVIDWLKNFQTAAYQNYLRECDVENQLIKAAAAIKLENLQEFNLIQEKVKKNAKVLTLL